VKKQGKNKKSKKGNPPSKTRTFPPDRGGGGHPGGKRGTKKTLGQRDELGDGGPRVEVQKREQEKNFDFNVTAVMGATAEPLRGNGQSLWVCEKSRRGRNMGPTLLRRRGGKTGQLRPVHKSKGDIKKKRQHPGF